METGWLIKSKCYPRYVGVAACGMINWVYTAERAIRFARKEDAVRMADALRLARPDFMVYSWEAREHHFP